MRREREREREREEEMEGEEEAFNESGGKTSTRFSSSSSLHEFSHSLVW